MLAVKKKQIAPCPLLPSACKCDGDRRSSRGAATTERARMSLPPVSPPLARLLYRSLLRTSARGKRPECLPMLVRHDFEPATPTRPDT